jgi:hypothetical protein
VKETLEALPDSLKQAFGEQMSGTPEQIKEAFVAILKLSEPRANVAAARVAGGERKKSKEAAQLRGGSGRAQPRQPARNAREAVLQGDPETVGELREAILAAPTTSVKDSIEWNK